MTPKNKNPTPPALLEQYDRIISVLPGVIRKGATMPYTSHNGHMFSFMDKAHKMSLRLPGPERESFIVEFSAALSFQNNTIMKEYVLVPEDQFHDLNLMQRLIGVSFAYLASLKPKAR